MTTERELPTTWAHRARALAAAPMEERLDAAIAELAALRERIGNLDTDAPPAPPPAPPPPASRPAVDLDTLRRELAAIGERLLELARRL